VSLGGSRSSDNHTTTDILTLDTTKKETRVVTSTGLVARLLKGLDIGDLGLDRVLLVSNNLNLGILAQNTTLNTTRRDSTTTGDGENFLNGHQERLVEVTLGGGDPSVNGVHEFVNLLFTNLGLATFQSAKSGTEDDGGLFTLEAVGGQKFTHFQFDKFQHLGVLDGIDLVDEDDDLLDTDLTGEEQVLTGLRPILVSSVRDKQLVDMYI
jgi:hypothetical protein